MTLWTPHATRVYSDEMEAAIADTDDPVETRLLVGRLQDQGIVWNPNPDAPAAAPPRICHAFDWGYIDEPDGRRLLAAFVDSDDLTRALVERVAVPPDAANVVVDVDWNADVRACCPALNVKLPGAYIFVPLESGSNPCPVDWRAECLRGFAVAVRNPDPRDSRVLHIASPPLDGREPAEPVFEAGRNDPCPCGSGAKFKKCHGT